MNVCKKRLQQADLIIDFQKKVGAAIWGNVGDAGSGRSEMIALTEQLAETVGVAAPARRWICPGAVSTGHAR